MPNSEGSMFKLNPAPKIITFDCYGTLVQWHEVLLRKLEQPSSHKVAAWQRLPRSSTPSRGTRGAWR